MKITDDDVYNYYIKNKGVFVKTVAKHFGLAPMTISKILKKQGVKIKRGNTNRRIHEINENYFETIDTEEKAYWLGFLYADGNVFLSNGRTYRTSLGLAEEDKEMVYRFYKTIFLKDTYKIEISKTNSVQDMYRVYIYSNKVGTDLIKQGCFPKKSLILKFPNSNQVPNNLLRHFIRGFFDGDGSFCKTNCDNCLGFSFVSSIFFCKELHKYLSSLDIICNISQHSKEAPSNYIVRGCSLGSLIKFYHLIYDDCNIYLPRKKDTIQQFFKKMENSLTSEKIIRYIGKNIDKKDNKWLCRFTFDKKRKHIGIFDSKRAAIKAYNLEGEVYKNKLTKEESSILSAIRKCK